eukprot:1159280-Pelagomonas_calceolata.AAC.4
MRRAGNMAACACLRADGVQREERLLLVYEHFIRSMSSGFTAQLTHPSPRKAHHSLKSHSYTNQHPIRSSPCWSVHGRCPRPQLGQGQAPTPRHEARLHAFISDQPLFGQLVLPQSPQLVQHRPVRWVEGACMRSEHGHAGRTSSLRVCIGAQHTGTHSSTPSCTVSGFILLTTSSMTHLYTEDVFIFGRLETKGKGLPQQGIS